MKVLSLFDGISCGRLALERAGITIDRYVAYEVDASARIVSNYNWPDIEHKGDVTKADFTQYREFDLLISGSPCQDLSKAGSGKGLAGPKSRLFWEYVRALKETHIKRFLFENVAHMKPNDKRIITETLGVKPISINSCKVSAQRRERYYWTNIPEIEQPEDRHIVLSDVINPPPYLKPGNLRINSATLKGYIEVSPGDVYDNSFRTSTTRRRSVLRDKSITVTCKPNLRQYLGGGDSRELTIGEYERLQTLPTGYTEATTKHNALRAIGNG